MGVLSYSGRGRVENRRLAQSQYIYFQTVTSTNLNGSSKAPSSDNPLVHSDTEILRYSILPLTSRSTLSTRYSMPCVTKK